jgi:hypothetical protein
MMLNVNWPQLRELYEEIKTQENIQDADYVTFQCVSKDVKTGKKTGLQKRVRFSDFLRVFWDLCESPIQILALVVTTASGTEIYKHHSRHPEMKFKGNSGSRLQWPR